jgi:small subunit ribosomal protein S6
MKYKATLTRMIEADSLEEAKQKAKEIFGDITDFENIEVIKIRKYRHELLLVLKQEDVNCIESFLDIVKANGGDVQNVGHWGMKKLSYPHRGCTDGWWYLIEFEASPRLVRMVREKAKSDEVVLMHSVIRKD